MKAITFLSHLNRKIYLQAFAVYVIRQWKFWISMVFYYLVLVALLGLFLANSFFISLMIVISWVIISLSFNFFSYLKELKRNPNLFVQNVWSVDQTIILGNIENHESKYVIKELKKVLETTRFIFLWTSSSGFILFRKKDIPSSDIGLLREYLGLKKTK